MSDDLIEPGATSDHAIIGGWALYVNWADNIDTSEAFANWEAMSPVDRAEWERRAAPFVRHLEASAAEIARLRADPEHDAREKVAAFMLSLSIATGHGDTLDDLLGELRFDILEKRERLLRARADALEEAAKLADLRAMEYRESQADPDNGRLAHVMEACIGEDEEVAAAIRALAAKDAPPKEEDGVTLFGMRFVVDRDIARGVVSFRDARGNEVGRIVGVAAAKEKTP